MAERTTNTEFKVDGVTFKVSDGDCGTRSIECYGLIVTVTDEGAHFSVASVLPDTVKIDLIGRFNWTTATEWACKHFYSIRCLATEADRP